MASPMVAGMALAAKPRPEIDISDDERKTPPKLTLSLLTTNLPGETNRQFAARMKAEAAT